MAFPGTVLAKKETKRKGAWDMYTAMLRGKRLRRLNKGTIHHIGILEAAGLKLAGQRDGNQGLPRQTEDGSWTSAFVRREADGYEEFCSRMWSMLQLEAEQAFARLNELTSAIPLTRQYIAEAEESLVLAQQEEIHFTRRKGEENLTEDQVHARRKREQEKDLEPVYVRLQQLSDQLEAQTAEVSQLCCKLEEDGNTIRMAVHRVRERTRQRVDIYWNAALRTHPKGMTMPVVPSVPLSNRAEEAYEALHRRITEKADALRIPGKEAA